MEAREVFQLHRGPKGERTIPMILQGDGITYFTAEDLRLLADTMDKAPLRARTVSVYVTLDDPTGPTANARDHMYG